MGSKYLGSKSQQIVFWMFHYLIFTSKLVTPQQSVTPPEGPSHMVNPDQVKAVIDSENSITNKVLTNGMSALDGIQKGASYTANNLGWYTTSLLSNTLKVLSNAMQALKDVGTNTLSASFQVGKSATKLVDGTLRGVVGYAKAGTQGLNNQLTNASSYLKNVSKNPDTVSFIPQAAISGVSAIIPSDAIKAVYNTTVASVGTVGWLLTNTLADTTQVLENTIDLIDNLGSGVVNTGYKLGEGGVGLTQSVVGGGYNMVENGISSAGQTMDGYSKSFKDKLAPQQLVDVPLTDPPQVRKLK